MRTSLGRALPILAGLLLLIAGAAVAEDTVYDIQLGVIAENTPVDVQGVVVTGVGRFGFFVQEPAANPSPPDPAKPWQYSGIYVFTNAAPTCKRGDMVNVTGVYAEYFGRSEIDCASSPYKYTVTGTGTIPSPVLVAIPEVNNEGVDAEAYEGVLIRVDRDDAALFAGALDAFNEWSVKRDISALADSLVMETFSALPGGDFDYTVPVMDTPMTFAQGILDYSYNEFKLCPRSCEEDLGAPCVPKLRGAYATNPTGVGVQFGVALDPVTAENTANYELGSGLLVLDANLDPLNPKRVYLVTEDLGNGLQESITCRDILSSQLVPMTGPEIAYFRTGITPIKTIQYVPSPGTSDVSPCTGEVVTIRGRITGVEGTNYYFMQDDDGKQWDNLYVRVAAYSPLKVGDELKVAGRVSEYNGLTELNYTSGVDYFVPLGTTAAVTTNNVITTQIRMRDAVRTAEPWESALVRLTGATVIDSAVGYPVPPPAGPYFGEWRVMQAGLPADTVMFDIDGLNGDKAYAACPGDVLTLTGELNYSFGLYRIYPRSGRGIDIVVTYDNPACAATSVEDGITGVLPPRLGSHPNPFGQTTTIRFTLPTADSYSLEILDPSGRVVRTLRDDVSVQAGQQSVVWDGRNDAGHAVGSGTYFARLRTQSGESASKLIIVK